MALIFHTFKAPWGYYLFDTSTNSVVILDESDYLVLSEIEKGHASANDDIVKRYQSKGFLKDISITEIRHPDDAYLEMLLANRQQMITLQVTRRCNLRCSYCTYSGSYKNRSHTEMDMSIETAKKAIDFAFSRQADAKMMYIGFYGGEPLLRLTLIKDCVAYVEETYGDKQVEYSITTNGTLLSVDTYAYLVEKGFSILVSIDGPKSIHDSCRNFKDGSGSFDKIIQNLKQIAIVYPDSLERIKINAVVTPQYDNDCSEQIFSIGDVLDYTSITMNFLSDAYIDAPYKYTEEFIAVYKREVCKLLLYLVGKIGKQNTSKALDWLLPTYMREHDFLKRIHAFPTTTHPGGPCVPGGTRLFVNINGDLFPCEKVSEISEPMRLGTLETGFDISKAKKLLNVGSITAEKCKKCWAILHCSNCAMYADDLKKLSSAKALTRCDGNKFNYEEILKTLCFLRMHGFDFQRKDVTAW